MLKTRSFSPLAIVVALLLLGGATYDRANNPTGHDAVPYLERVRTHMAEMPLRLGMWSGVEAPVPRSAISLLRPNVLVSRRYTDLLTGRQAALLIVHCGDARDMLGHYPPVCYRNSGWKEERRADRTWTAGRTTIDGVEYAFTGNVGTNQTSLVVMNAMVLPNGTFRRDMDAVRGVAADSNARVWGAGQVQVILDGSVPAAERDEIFASLAAAHEPWLRTMLGKFENISGATAVQGRE